MLSFKIFMLDRRSKLITEGWLEEDGEDRWHNRRVRAYEQHRKISGWVPYSHPDIPIIYNPPPEVKTKKNDEEKDSKENDT